MFYGHFNQEVQSLSLQQKFNNTSNVGTNRGRGGKRMRKNDENRRKRRKQRNPNHLPGNAKLCATVKKTDHADLEQRKDESMQNKTFEKVFSNISFKIAYANSKNIKQLIVRTKV